MFQETGRQIIDKNNPTERADVKADPKEFSNTNDVERNYNGKS